MSFLLRIGKKNRWNLKRWFKIHEIPYDKMWDDDKVWLPNILEGKKLKADFIFKEGEILSSQNVKIIEKLE